MELERLASCAELTTDLVAEAASSQAGMRTLMAWAANVARPGNGSPKLLMAFAKMAFAEWLDGMPVVEIAGDASATSISIFTEHGLDIRERVVPATRLLVPFEEFARAVRLGPQLVSPFRWKVKGATLTLALDPEATVSMRDPREAIRIDPSSLRDAENPTSPPPPGHDQPDSAPFQSGIHTHPTVRRMVAVSPAALRSGNDDD